MSQPSGPAELDLREQVEDALGRARPAREGGAYTCLTAERALALAEPLGRPAGPLQATTFAVKDLIAVRGLRRGGGSQTQANTAPCRADAPAVEALLGAGSILIGLTTLHELAFGVTGINLYTGTPENPAAPGRVPGGSSSGSAAAVASGSVDLALGTDTGGSVRIPAALCGIVGYKPPRGAISTKGVLALSGSLDHVGVLARSVALARVFDEVSCGSRRQQTSTTRTIAVDPTRVEHCEGAVATAFSRAIDALSAAYRIVEVRLPNTEAVVAVTGTIMFYEAAQLYGDLAVDEHSGLGDDVRERLLAGARINRADYAAALDDQPVFTDAVREILDAVDAIAEPTVPICAPPLAEAPPLGPIMVAHTRLANLTGFPAMSVPIEGQPLPVGLQLTAADRWRLFEVAEMAERLLFDEELA